ncbi:MULTISPECIES: sigma 54-interacting transcriptional regulator [unclassified Roseovarius]|uniref:sigma 54-interacting transcriptional regulator n=1 Tax=unclassified Roseovarius TaxID=2614913 RepID=UPI00273E1EE3|nr:sigma 54-interacting transcriptional regulator [Roseovarius sp. MMSF_3350]
MKILMAWTGTQDLDAPTRPEGQTGPICSAVEERRFDRLVLIANQDGKRVATYKDWLSQRTTTEIVVEHVQLIDPTDLNAIHEIAVDVVERSRQAVAPDIPELTFHLSPGTWAMALVWAILGATRFPAKFLQSSKEGGVQTIEVPFDVSAELLPKIIESADARLAKLSGGLDTKTFGDLIFRSPAMNRMASKAKKAAVRNVPILIEGEAGTEKEVLARAIHEFGPRRTEPFVSLNCGALKPDQIDAEIFGSDNGAGALAEASGGTLYLDEVELLPAQAQVRLQVLLDEMTGDEAAASQVGRADVRIIAATRKQLIDAVAAGDFREELFFGLAVLVLKIPPLRERKGDLGPLIEMLLERINEQSADEPGFEKKTLSPGAKNVLLQRTWPGNLRELENSLRRAAIWSEGSQITEDDVWDAVFTAPAPAGTQNGILDKSLDEGVNLQEIMAEVARHYITRAIAHAEGNKTNAAKLIGLPSYQTLTNWMTKYGVS